MRSSLRCSSEDWQTLVEMLEIVGVGPEVVFRFPVKSYDLVGINIRFESGKVSFVVQGERPIGSEEGFQ